MSNESVSLNHRSGVPEAQATVFPNEYGFSLSFIHERRGGNGTSYVGPTYVKRTCEGGCHRTLEFTPLPGMKRFQMCSACKRVTSWRVVA